MKTNDLKKGAVIRLRNGWVAVVYDNMRGNTRMCKVFGYETEIGSVYSHDIQYYYPYAKEVDGQIIGPHMGPGEPIEHVAAQKKLRAVVGAAF